MPDARDSSSYWNATCDAPGFPRLAQDTTTDVVIIGGGIVGCTTARLLKDKGLRVVLLEARRAGRQVTGKSTAKMTSQHGLIYQTLEQKFDTDHARLYGEAQQSAIEKIRSLAREHSIDCDIEEKSAFVYTREEKSVDRIETEAEVARRLGLPAVLTRDTGLPFEVSSAIRFDGQAQFHPTKYVAGLAQTIPGDGCHVFENSPVTDWEPTRVVTRTGSVGARHVIMATHLPLGQIGGFYTAAHPYAEPVAAARIQSPPPGMYISVDQPGHSIRTHRRENGEVYAIVAGESFKPGHTDDERRYMADLQRWLLENFDSGPIEYQWINEDYSSVDKLPFVGWSATKDGYLVATGFAAWGISNGTAAAMILAELAAGNHHPWLSLFDATRTTVFGGAAQYVKENAIVGAHLVGGYLSRKLHSFDELPPGQAAIMRIDGKHVAAYRDDEGRVHSVSAVCPHMGCIVGWNETDRTWDCPCHGSRFGLDGEVMHGPATAPLGSASTG
ncbi:FAD-dependent oxidoreductase [Sinorhizobium terangae]|uniref:FAD-dependent oxidoreductase n=1 Tax=Sinorhizobium terangae TaxID=110322 RepID=UPI0024B0847B|nr:FAD-dependent oxidoreductase [Sinorhizobium terangae]WFU50841.1 FAD-dependent oxidoreductase [Sinorhizobium terangae]